MEALRTHDIGEGGDEHMESAMTDIDNEKTGMDLTERYVGPNAWWIANLLSHRVRFQDGWFWTTASCHSLRDDGLAFRQRPDGNGIDVRCHTGGCSPEMATDALSWQIGWPIRNSYEPLEEPVDGFWWIRHWPRWRFELYGAAALAFSVPLLLGHDVEAAVISYLCFSVGAGLTLWHQTRRRSWRFRRR